MLQTVTLIDASFVHCSSTLLRGGKGEKNKTVQTAVVRIVFVSDCLRNQKNLKCSILELIILSKIEGMHLPIKSPSYKP